jgi:hypothetical protein
MRAYIAYFDAAESTVRIKMGGFFLRLRSKVRLKKDDGNPRNERYLSWAMSSLLVGVV